MKVKTQEPMLDIYGNQIPHHNGMPATFASTVCEVLNIPIVEFDKNKNEDHFIFLFRLCKKIQSNSELSFDPYEIETIRERVTASGHLTCVKCKIYEMLDEVMTNA